MTLAVAALQDGAARQLLEGELAGERGSVHAIIGSAEWLAQAWSREPRKRPRSEAF